MNETEGLDIVVVATPDVISELEEELKRANPSASVTTEPVERATDLSLDLGEAARLITELPVLLTAGAALVSALRSVFQRRESPTRIQIESPLGKVTFEGRPDMSEEEIRAALTRLTTL
ncbi:MAG: hypothetical protein HW413_1665 [Thermoleophilia bacterium]|nr:hypothetical protein [Thermoleophilia bacterium]